MSLHLPRLRGTGTHRAASPAELRDENRRLLAIVTGSDEAFTRLRQERRDALDDADRMRIRAIAAENEAAAMQAELNALRAFKANVTTVSAPAGERDIDPGDEPTQPVPLWQAPIAGPAIAVPHTRQVT